MKLLIFCLFLLLSFVASQFGLKNDNLQEASIGVDGTIDTKTESLAKELQLSAPISAEDAVHIALILKEA